MRLVYLETGLLVVVVLSSLYSTLTETMMLPHRQGYLQRWANNVHDYEKGSNLTNPHFTADKIYEYAASLDRMKMTVFREQ